MSVEARGDSEAGILIRFDDPNNLLVAGYSPTLKGVDPRSTERGNTVARLGLTEFRIRLDGSPFGGSTRSI